VTRSPNRRSRLRRAPRVGVGPQLTALLAAIVALVAVPFGVVTSSAGAVPLGAETLVTYAPSSAHPFSDPIWLPLRTPARISCVKTNCLNSSGGDYHGYWAIDFIGQRGDPVYAAGGGVFHVGANSKTCSTTSSQSAGVWAWVDHGGGRVTKYTHLDTLVATDGQLVTPQTVIGKMGHWGDVSPCTANYLHFEVRERGITGPRVNPGSLLACTASGRVSLPGVFNGATSFDALPKGAFTTPAATSACITDVWNSTPPRPPLTVARKPSAAKLTWGTPPAGTTSVRVATQLWSPSLSAWNSPVYTTVSGAPSGTTLTGLTNGRKYRIVVTHKNASGYSAWSVARTVVPATVPSAPKAPRFLTSPTRDYVHYGWWKSNANGAAVTGYTTQVRCYRDGRYRAWTTKYVGASTYYYNHRGLTGYATCQVRVRATNGMGVSAWSTTSTIRKSR
jgi:hypothetical protein